MYKDDNIFDSLYNNNKYNELLNTINSNNIKLKKVYIQYPTISLKRNFSNNNNWIFKNVYNNYFCFCKGENCLNVEIQQKCKYYMYINIIDNNRNIYKKTDYFFADFIFSYMPSDDTYPVFQKMEKENLPVHYITEKKDIFNKYCNNKRNCLTILLIDRKMYINYGDFVEKYLSLILKLKAVISGKIAPFHYISKLFYDIEYITYISVGHGVCFFKYYLYEKNQIYGINKNNKILLPPSNKIISIAKEYGWKDRDIIKINLPRWDKYNIDNIELLDKDNEIKSNSIFIMFTWRAIKNNKQISSFYHENILKLLTNNILNQELIRNNIFLYFTLHRFMFTNHKFVYENITKMNKNIKLIKQIEISKCLSKTSLVVSDFSSIIFDMIYRRMPYIIYIPDSNDPQIKNIYRKDCFEFIHSIKNDSIKFENKFYNIKETVNKIIYYINNKFKIEKNLQKFYDSFEFKSGNNINKFIIYLKRLK